MLLRVTTLRTVWQSARVRFFQYSFIFSRHSARVDFSLSNKFWETGTAMLEKIEKHTTILESYKEIARSIVTFYSAFFCLKPVSNGLNICLNICWVILRDFETIPCQTATTTLQQMLNKWNAWGLGLRTMCRESMSNVEAWLQHFENINNVEMLKQSLNEIKFFSTCHNASQHCW